MPHYIKHIRKLNLGETHHFKRGTLGNTSSACNRARKAGLRAVFKCASIQYKRTKGVAVTRVQ